MAYRLSRLIAENGWNILTARVGQWAGRGAAAFYIQGDGGRALTEDEVRAALDPKV
jgi:[protein-PII] uridylyltransferase